MSERESSSEPVQDLRDAAAELRSAAKRLAALIEHMEGAAQRLAADRGAAPAPAPKRGRP